MACRLFGAKPLPEPMPAYCQPDSWEQILMKDKDDIDYLCPTDSSPK